MSVAIVSFGMGNVGSVANVVTRLGHDAVVTSDPAEIDRADHVILPGVGAFDAAMANLERLGLVDELRRQVDREVPLLGICLGMQLLASFGDEGGVSGLGVIPGRVVRLPSEHGGTRLPLPHMGWNQLYPAKPSKLLEGLSVDARFYFVHTYHFLCDDGSDVLATTPYGDDFVSAVERGPVVGTQFHPEKSHKDGVQLIANFLDT